LVGVHAEVFDGGVQGSTQVSAPSFMPDQQSTEELLLLHPDVVVVDSEQESAEDWRVVAQREWCPCRQTRKE
jgi:hypothetical protein